MKVCLLRVIGAVISVAAMVSQPPTAAQAQTRDVGPWWPHPDWGAEDQAGASQRVTPEKILGALRMATTGDVYELGHPYEAEMPTYPGRTYSMTLPAIRNDMGGGANQIVGRVEFLASQIGQVGTQFDGLGHIGQVVEMENGDIQRVFYNGYTAEEIDSETGLLKLGIEHVRPIITRGVLVDVAGYKGVERLPHSYEVTVEDVRGALARQGMTPDDIEPGDAILFRYGWSSLWSDPEAFNHNPPGIGVAVARWVAELQPAMVGSDSWATEVLPNPIPELAFPVHQELLTKRGIYNLESMQLDELAEDGVSSFLFIVTTIRFKGATGSPVRPIAVR
jgi:kynurenine formamidase